MAEETKKESRLMQHNLKTKPVYDMNCGQCLERRYWDKKHEAELREIDVDKYLKENLLNIIMYRRLHSHSGILPEDFLSYFIHVELLGEQ